MPIEVDAFGETPGGGTVERFRLMSASGDLRISVISYGAIIVSIETPDRQGRLANIVLGYDSMAGYLEDPAHMGGIVGRCANRIRHGRFRLDGNEVTLSRNHGAHHLHGGHVGLDRVVWRGEPLADGSGVSFSYRSADGEDGYPGTLDCQVRYRLVADDELELVYRATTDQPTPVNLSQHSYFNLSGEPDVLSHELAISADHFLPVDADLIPIGEHWPVEDSPFDFRGPKPIGRDIGADDTQLRLAQGYDHCYVRRGPVGTLSPAARLTSPLRGRVLEVDTTQPGVQLYSANALRDRPRGGVCLECQHYPDSPNRPDFPSCILRPGQVYEHITRYRFGVL